MMRKKSKARETSTPDVVKESLVRKRTPSPNIETKEDEEELILGGSDEEMDTQPSFATLDDVLERHNRQLASFIRTYRLTSSHENFFVIFGTFNVCLALVFPFKRLLPLRGLEWSFMTLDGNDEEND